MGKLCQVIAAEKGLKQAVLRDVTDIYQQLQKAPLLSGIRRTYQPKDEEGDRLPSEVTRVQLTVESAMVKVKERLTELFDVTATKEEGNRGAEADIVVDGKVIAAKVPVTYLLFLEKQLTDIATFVKKLPTLDPSESWTWDKNQGCFVTEPAGTLRTKKVFRNHVKAEATEKHPAQVEVYSEDVPIGTWTTVKMSGAITPTYAQELARRVEQLQIAVKAAREEANALEVKPVKIGHQIFDYLFG